MNLADDGLNDRFTPPTKAGYPKTKDEWWQYFNWKREELREIVHHYHPGYERRHNYPISAAAAEAVCEMVRKKIKEETTADPVAEFDKAVEEKDAMKLVVLMNAAWFGLPESWESRTISGFGVLCDLCSESYVLEEEQADED
jgi:hypothetical protein